MEGAHGWDQAQRPPFVSQGIRKDPHFSRRIDDVHELNPGAQNPFVTADNVDMLKKPGSNSILIEIALHDKERINRKKREVYF